MYLSFNLIVGFSLGIEYQEDEDFTYLIFDLFLIRMLLAKEKNEFNQD